MHLLHAAQPVEGGVLWVNLHLLFWLSLAPFATAWVGEINLPPCRWLFIRGRSFILESHTSF